MDLIKVNLEVSATWQRYYSSYLSLAEHKEYRLTRHPGRARSFAISRAVLRQVLGQQFMLHPQEIVINTTPTGKPVISESEPYFCHFNISHTNSTAIIALHPTNPIGVDVESVRERLEVTSFSTRFFSPEEQHWISNLAPGEQKNAFYRLWTRKEAIMKATGSGMSLDLLKTPPLIDVNTQWVDNMTMAMGMVRLVDLTPRLNIPNHYAAVAMLSTAPIRVMECYWYRWSHKMQTLCNASF